MRLQHTKNDEVFVQVLLGTELRYVTAAQLRLMRGAVFSVKPPLNAPKTVSREQTVLRTIHICGERLIDLLGPLLVQFLFRSVNHNATTIVLVPGS